MKTIQLTGGASALIKTRDEITERQDQRIRKSQLRAAAVTSKLQVATAEQVDAMPILLAANLTDADFDVLNGMSEVLLQEMVLEVSSIKWDPAGVLDLKKSLFDELADACLREYLDIEEFGPDGAVDPLVPTAD